jgi:hypothetical protein
MTATTSTSAATRIVDVRDHLAAAAYLIKHRAVSALAVVAATGWWALSARLTSPRPQHTALTWNAPGLASWSASCYQVAS